MARATGILGVEYALGTETLSYEELEQRFGADAMKKVMSGAGIRNRRVAAQGVLGSDMAVEAAQTLLATSGTDPASVDLLIHCTQSPDYFLPTTACIMHQRLGLSKTCAAFDLNLGCSQYVYALSVAHSMIQSGVANKALVTTGDNFTTTLHPMDRSIVPLMGDAGSATLIGPVPDARGFLGFELGTDGSGHHYLCIPDGGFRNPIGETSSIAATDAEGNTRAPRNFFMNGAAVFHFAISTVPKAIQALLGKLNLAHEQIDLFLFHQANKYMIDYLAKKLKIGPEKTHVHLEDIGNTSGTSMPIVLKEAWKSGKVKPGSLVLMIVFGVGLSWAATVVRWPDDPAGGAA